MTRIAYCPRCRSVTPLKAPRGGGAKAGICPTCGGPLEERAGRHSSAKAVSPTVLCIDDDRLLLSMLCDAIEVQGYQALLATDGPSGIETAKNARPDVILLDVMMPGMTGIEVCRRLRAEPELRDTPIILLTALPDLGLDAEGQAAGATLTLRKPFGSAAVSSAIHEILSKQRTPRKR
jgi:CheY-like chemotaxis protein